MYYTVANRPEGKRYGMNFEEMKAKIADGKGFIAALDQSGGSTPKALAGYGVAESEYSGEDEMFAKIHEMRCRIVESPVFTGDKVVGAILFEKTMEGCNPEGMPIPERLAGKGIVPFLKVDKGMHDTENGVQLMKDMPQLADQCARAKKLGVFGTKMRSVVSAANREGIAAIVDQQFEVGKQILAKGLVPILEPEVTISIDDKAEAEDILLEEITKHLDALDEGQEIMLKLSLPTKANQYASLIAHPRVIRVVALSGSYARDEANALLAKNEGMIASFSRALTEGLSAQQSDDEFNATIAEAIDGIYRASIT